jgi:hypothetical protein
MFSQYRCRFCNGAIHWFCSVDPEEKGHGAHYVCQPCYDTSLSCKGSASKNSSRTTASEPGSVLQSVHKQQSDIAAESAKWRKITVTVPNAPTDKAVGLSSNNSAATFYTVARIAASQLKKAVTASAVNAFSK